VFYKCVSAQSFSYSQFHPMTSYNFALSASWWLLVLCGVLAAALAVYSYRVTVPPTTPLRKAVLVVLRTLALWILLFVLFEPIVNIIRATEEPARIATLLDDSQSAGLNDASLDRKAMYRDLLAALKPENLPGADVLPPMVFDADVRVVERFTADSLNFKGQLTNIAKALNTVLETAERVNTRAVVLVSDGAFNAGENPLYTAEMLGRPVFAVGVGDSTEPRDLAVQSLIANEIAYVGAALPVNVNVQTSGFERGEARVLLRDNGAVVGEQRFVLSPNRASNGERQTTTFSFAYTPKEAGSRKLTAEVLNISGFEGELTVKNNAFSEFVTVLKNKRKVVIVSGQPTPDISFIRTALTENRNVECVAFVEMKSGEFLDDAETGKNLVEQLSVAESLVLVGFPSSSTPPSVIDAVKTELARGKPVLFVASRDIDYGKLRALEPYLPFVTVSVGKQEMLVLPDVKAQAMTSPVMKISGTDEDAKRWNSLPPLFRTETFFKMKPESEMLASVRVNNVPLNEPLIVQRTLGGAKSLAILGYGVYRWKLLGYAAEVAKGREELPDVFGAFLENGLRWLTTNEQGKFVRIKTTRQLYANGETVEFTAQVYDKSYNPLDNADVRVTITGGSTSSSGSSGAKGTPREIPLSALGGGRYIAQVQGLLQGDYTFSGVAAVNNQPYGTDDGRFTVGELNIEYQNLRMNAALLRRIAERTGGKFYTAQELARNPDQLLRDIRALPSFKARPVTERNEFALWSLPYLLGAAVVLLSAEWLLRKRAGMV
jgi:hypothetical protein